LNGREELVSRAELISSIRISGDSPVAKSATWALWKKLNKATDSGK
jgi:hypothetical protein